MVGDMEESLFRLGGQVLPLTVRHEYVSEFQRRRCERITSSTNTQVNSSVSCRNRVPFEGNWGELRPALPFGSGLG